MQRCFAIVNQSTTTDPAFGGELTQQVLAELADALAAYLNEDVAPTQGFSYIVRAAAPDGSDIVQGEAPFYIGDTIDNAPPGVAAYHMAAQDGTPVGFAARDEYVSLMGDGNPFTMALSEGIGHEFDEIIGDVGANQYADRPDGTEEALELCDRVQGTGYMKGGIAVPNFLLPPAFDPGAPGPWDFKGVLQSQYGVTPQGYVILRSIGPVLGVRGVAGRHLRMRVEGPGVALFSEQTMARKRHPTSRTYRRGVRL